MAGGSQRKGARIYYHVCAVNIMLIISFADVLKQRVVCVNALCLQIPLGTQKLLQPHVGTANTQTHHILDFLVLLSHYLVLVQVK